MQGGRATRIDYLENDHCCQDPLLFLHGVGEGCAECDEARRSTLG
jgi:hypothetical protein